MLRINIVTIFPDFFRDPLALSIPAAAASAGSVEYRVVDLRDFTHDRHRTAIDCAQQKPASTTTRMAAARGW